MAQNATTAPKKDLIGGYQGYGLGIFTDEHASSDEFIVYMEEVTIPDHDVDDVYDIHLVSDDGTRTRIGSVLPEVCCGHAGEGEGDDEDPHEGRLMFNYVSPNGDNLFARYSGVDLMLAGEVIFQDIMPLQSLPFLRALLVEDSAQGYAGYAPTFKRLGERLLEMSTEAVESDELSAVQAIAEAMYGLLLGGGATTGLYSVFDQILTQAEVAAHMPGTKPALMQRLKEIQSLYEKIEPQILELVLQSWSTAFHTRTPARARKEAQQMLDAAEALYHDAKKLYKTCQQMSWLAPATV